MKLVMVLLLASLCAGAQSSYKDSANNYIKRYITNHELIKGTDKQYLQFYEANPDFRVVSHFEKVENSNWFKMEATGTLRQLYRIYGRIHFNIHDTAVVLTIYQSQSLMQNDQYKDYLFIPFADASCGFASYEGGRYIDIRTGDIENDVLVIDFNKAYNPYCAYEGKYNCPIPPKENRIAVAILAGEKKFGKSH